MNLYLQFASHSLRHRLRADGRKDNRTLYPVHPPIPARVGTSFVPTRFNAVAARPRGQNKDRFAHATKGSRLDNPLAGSWPSPLWFERVI